jgi:hypothetical protein
VEVVAGPLKGVKGEVLLIKGGYRILLRFESLGCCVHAEISQHELAPVERKSNGDQRTAATR